MIEEAVILAAGTGARLSDSMANMPKGFIIIDQQPIIDESVRKLLKYGRLFKKNRGSLRIN